MTVRTDLRGERELHHESDRGAFIDYIAQPRGRAVTTTAPLCRTSSRHDVASLVSCARPARRIWSATFRTRCSHPASNVLLASGDAWGLRAIQELAGHQELTMTQRYTHLSPAA